LGTAPALAPGAAPRRYRDSGMRWVREGLAGRSDSAGPDSFSLRPLEEAVADLVALIEAVRPDVVIGYADEGTYGHPDHVRAHHLAVEACARAGTPLVEIVSALPEDDRSAPGIAVREHPGTGEAVLRAVESYRTQLTVVGQQPGGIAIRHVGGQDDVAPLRTGLHLRSCGCGPARPGAQSETASRDGRWSAAPASRRSGPVRVERTGRAARIRGPCVVSTASMRRSGDAAGKVCSEIAAGSPSSGARTRRAAPSAVSLRSPPTRTGAPAPRTRAARCSACRIRLSS